MALIAVVTLASGGTAYLLTQEEDEPASGARSGTGSGPTDRNDASEKNDQSDPVEVTPDPTEPTGSTEPSVTADPEEQALDELERLAAQDAQRAEALGYRWTTHLTSKRVGTQADGIVYDNVAILELHERLVAAHPDALLLWSSEWDSFQIDGYWVTVSGVTFDRPQDAVRWCRNQGYANDDDCAVKRLRHVGDWREDTHPWGP